jgi:predicted enzyme related to lactoylglutathione lyase|nr:glyoxalase/bleomycin resistance/dioxygenase family protein [Mycobacterium sp. URHB0044]
MTVATIKRIAARVEVPDIDAALPLYTQLAGVPPDAVIRVTRNGIDIAFLGDFVLLAGPDRELVDSRRVATVIVDDIAWAAEVIGNAGGDLLEGPADAQVGQRLLARHPDGGVFEYLQFPN